MRRLVRTPSRCQTERVGTQDKSLTSCILTTAVRHCTQSYISPISRRLEGRVASLHCSRANEIPPPRRWRSSKQLRLPGQGIAADSSALIPHCMRDISPRARSSRRHSSLSRPDFSVGTCRSRAHIPLTGDRLGRGQSARFLTMRSMIP